jgi:predicted PurR-regulated permease PerM
LSQPSASQPMPRTQATPPDDSPEWSPRTKRTVALLLLLALLILAYFVSEILPIVVISALLAFILNPIATLVAGTVLSPFPKKSRRSFAIILTFVLVLLALIAVLLLILPVLGQQVQEFLSSLPRLLRSFEQDIERVLSQPITFGGEPILISGEPFVPLERLAEVIGTNDLTQAIQLGALDLEAALQTAINSAPILGGSAFSFLGGAFNTLINLVFLIMMTFYLLKDGGLFIRSAIDIVPDEQRSDARRLVGDLGYVWNAYLRGQLILCLVIGFAVYAAATLLGLPNAPILGLIAGLLEFIPNIGPFIALIPAAFLALVSDSSTLPFLSGVPFMLVVIVVWTLIQNVEAVFLVPRIMGDSLDLHPYVVIVGVIGGAALAGPLGVILAAPMIASGRVVLTYVYGKLTGRPPFVEREPSPPSPGPLTRAMMKGLRWMWARIRERASAPLDKRKSHETQEVK